MANPEYIVVGSGAGGGPLAARLAELGHRVLLLEAGGDDEPWTYQVPAFHGLATEDEAMRLDHYVRHYADEPRQQRDPKYQVERVAGRSGVLYPRARTLGGCTAHYAMIIVRPHDSDWETIRAATGDDSWAPHAMDSYFARVERCLYRGPGGGHGEQGWLPTRFSSALDLSTQVLSHRDAAIARIVASAAAGLPGINGARDPRTGSRDPLFNVAGRVAAKIGIDVPDPFDPNDRRVLDRHETGLLMVPMAIEKEGPSAGRRAGTRERIRAAANSTGRLEVRLRCHVTGLIFDAQDERRVVGVRYLRGERLYRADRDATRFGSPTGPTEEVRAEREVILSTGAFITPQLLMLSGIGPEAELSSLGIKVRQHLPGVGMNLQDRYEVGVVAKSTNRFRVLDDATFKGPAADEPGDPLFEDWKDGKGIYATNGAVLGFIERSSVVAEDGEPDLFIFGVPGRFDGYYSGWSTEAIKPPHDKWTWLVLKAHTRFSGRVTLSAKDPLNALEPPDVNFNYFERDATGAPTPDAGADLVAMRDGVRFVKRMLENCKDIVALHPEIMAGVDLETDAGIDAFVQDHAWGHHASCTCKIGGDHDAEAVLDSSFRVRGLKGLRVVDASVFPRIPGFFVVMPTYMISEKAADVIHAQAGTT
jgi:choline dehydrogenase